MNDIERQPNGTESRGVVKANDPYAVLRNRDLRIYLTGRLIAIIGQQMFVMGLGWELYERTRSALVLGFVGLTQVIPMILCTLPAGHFADIYNRKHIIVLMTLIVAGANLALAGISAASAPVLLIYLCLIVTGAARTFLWAASASFLPQLVGRKEFSQAVTWSSSTFQIGSITGPAIGGIVLHFTHQAAWIYMLNVLAAVSCAVLVSRVRVRHVAVTAEKTTLKTLLTGFSFVFKNRIILGIITLDMFAVLLGGATALLPVYAKEILHVGPYGLGLLQAALPFGAIICAFVLAHRPPLQKAGQSMLWAVVLFGLATILFGVSQWFWLSFAMLAVCGVSDNVSIVVRHTLVQLLTPNEKRGRVSAVNNLFIGTSNELGEFESGIVANWFGPAMGNAMATGAMISVVSGGVGTILVVLVVAWIWPEIRRYGRLDGS
ncbi:MAG: MFS transporter [Verrucomicrobia bacterium]|jgi:MFS family permease|nr:MFS transporter [Verrucomicrobiota bacterium]